jgi:hypothetical protein
MLHRTKVQQRLLHRTNPPHLPLKEPTRVRISVEMTCQWHDAREWNGRAELPLSRAGTGPNQLHSERWMFKNWMRFTQNAMLLGLESQRVMGLRLMKLSRGGRAAQSEALRMFSEKTTALAEAGTTLARGGSAGTVIRRYRTHVRSNKRRLSKS